MNLNEILAEALNSETNERKVLYNHYVRSLYELLDAKRLIEEKEKEIRNKISEYKGFETKKLDLRKASYSIDSLKNASGDFPVKGSWADKILYLLQRSDNGLTAKEIVEGLKKMQPDLAEKDINSSVYPTLSDNSKEGQKFKRSRDQLTSTYRFQLRTKN